MEGRFTRLFQYAVPYWRGWALIVAATLFSTACALLQPWPMKVLVDHVLGDQPMGGFLAGAAATLPGADTRQGLLGWVVAAGLIIFVLNSIVDVALTMTWTRVGRRMVYDLASDVFAHVQRRSLLFHTRHPVGDSLSRITGDSWSAYTVVAALLFAPGHAIFTLVAMVILMASLDPWLTLLALAVSPFMAGSAWYFGSPLRLAARAKREVESLIQSHVQQTLTGIPVVQAFTREDVEHQRFKAYAEAAIRAEQRSALVGSVFGLSAGLITTLGTGAVLWFAAVRVLDGYLTLGGTLVFLSYLTTLQTQFTTLSETYKTMQTAGASVDRVNEVLSAEDATDSPATTTPHRRLTGHVRFEHVTFGYDADRPVLRDVSLEARPGERVALVGTTGSGKSTLMALLPRFFDAWSGRVEIDGYDVRDIPRTTLREHIAMVFQDPYLFPMSVADNIAYGRPGATRDEIEAAARVAGAHAFVAALPDGYDTVLGERGATLSGGERQRLSIARAVLKDAPILILDEPTSALDAETEASVLRALERLMIGRTTFIVAHRLSTIRTADRIAVMRDGVLVEQGTHDELLEASAVYAGLCQLQFGGADPERVAVAG